MKIALYGLPCSGKTTLMAALKNIRSVNGSETLNKMSGGKFSSLVESEKVRLREEYAKYIGSLQDNMVISDGHYSFMNNVVFTEKDASVYDVFIYLYCRPELICERYSCSQKNKKYAGLSLQRITDWQDKEIEELRSVCHCLKKDFYVVKSEEITPHVFADFLNSIKNGFSSYDIAERIAQKIKAVFPQPCRLYLCDGDKTLIEQDSFELCSGGYKTHVFDGSFYTGFQSWLFSCEICNIGLNHEKLKELTINRAIYKRIEGKNFVVLSSGLTELWRMIGERFKIDHIFADTMISADTKYYVARLLRESGYSVTAFGDSKNDLYMLRTADIGYLYLGHRMSVSLRKADVSGIRLIYDKAPVIINESDTKAVSADIKICRSDSGINGARLAAAHFRCGQITGEYISRLIPEKNTAVVVLERGGRFFGDGLYCAFGGALYTVRGSCGEIPFFKCDKVIIADSVINTGASVLKMISVLEERNPHIRIIIAANVIQKAAIELLKNYKIFAVRISNNSFVGRNQSFQSGGFGPDTADRLFNILNAQ